MTTYQDAINFIKSFPDLDHPLHKPEDKPYMTPVKMKRVLQSLKNPHHDRGTVHVTGTKGKGSVASLIAGALNELDGPSGLFVCPHLISYTERISIDSCPVTEADFASSLSKLESLLNAQRNSDQERLSQFHVVIALFFTLLREHTPPVKWQVLEVGMGGKNDSTNVFNSKELAVFTSMHLEHQEFFGDTLSHVIENKAGIITPGCHVIVAPQKHKIVTEKLRQRAEEQGCKITSVEDNYTCTNFEFHKNRQTIEISGPYGKEFFTTRLIGEHQIENTMTALAAIDALSESGIKRNTDEIQKGFAQAYLPGRFKVIASDPTVIADGAHTPESAEILNKFIDKQFNYSKKILIVATGKDKNVGSIISNLLSNCDHLIVTKTNHSKSLEPENLKERATKVFAGSIEIAESIEEALVKAKSLASKDDLILVTGSLHAAAEAQNPT